MNAILDSKELSWSLTLGLGNFSVPANVSLFLTFSNKLGSRIGSWPLESLAAYAAHAAHGDGCLLEYYDPSESAVVAEVCPPEARMYVDVSQDVVVDGCIADCE